MEQYLDFNISAGTPCGYLISFANFFIISTSNKLYKGSDSLSSINQDLTKLVEEEESLNADELNEKIVDLRNRLENLKETKTIYKKPGIDYIPYSVDISYSYNDHPRHDEGCGVYLTNLTLYKNGKKFFNYEASFSLSAFFIQKLRDNDFNLPSNLKTLLTILIKFSHLELSCSNETSKVNVEKAMMETYITEEVKAIIDFINQTSLYVNFYKSL